MIDLHCHILPGVDDGADCIDTACEMAALAASSGIDTIVATPHCNTLGSHKNYCGQSLTEKFHALQAALDQRRIPVQILPGAEVLARENLPELLTQHKLQTINGTRYLLVEFYFDENPYFMDSTLKRIQSLGYIPVVAHPERYRAVQENPSIAPHWFRLGYALQLNKGSLLGRLGTAACQTGEELLRRGFVSLIASDAHSSRVRTPDVSKLYQYLEQRYPRNFIHLLLYENPYRIIRNRALVSPHRASV